VSDERAARPITFLVSIAGGRAPVEVLELIAPALERIGDWRKVAHPESSLAHHVARVEELGGMPVHLAIGAAHECYLTPAVPTMLLPLWDYPEVPATDLNRNSRMNWARVAGKADLILAPSEFVVSSFRRTGVTTPAVVAPIPIRDGWHELPTWGPDLPVTAHVPHMTWGGAPNPAEHRAAAAARRHVAIADERTPAWPRSEPALPLRARVIRAAKRRLRRIKPYFSNAAIEQIDAYKARLMPLFRRPSPVRLALGVTRFGYRHLVRRWIGERAHGKLRGLVLRLRGHRPEPPPQPPAPATLAASHLTLSGLVYSATIDYDEPTTDDVALITAFLHAFADRPDVTLLIRLNTTPARESHDLGRLWHVVHAPRIDARCRVVVVPGPVDEGEARILGHAASYHVETARSRGLSIPLLNALASGRPAIVPDHSSYAEWVDGSVGLVVASHAEPTGWPMDGLCRHATTWNRVDWSDLRDRLRESAAIADHDPVRYEALSATARDRMGAAAHTTAMAEALRDAVELLPSRPLRAYAWA
jgi:glycosyltransferase involved in cell wall biosynthesis